MPDHPIFTVGGTVQAGGGIYLPRPADDELLRHCLDGDFCYVLTARQMGKSSLMVRTAERLEAAGTRAVIIDLTRLGTTLQADQWYLGLLDELVEQLDLDVDYKAWWETHAHLGPTHRLGRFLRESVLEALDSPLVIFIDEIDTTLSLSFSDDFFAAIRACYNARSTDPAYKRLSFVLLGVATPGDLIRDPQRTPFNIGQRIDLTDFNFKQALPLAEGFDLPPALAAQVLKWILDWTGGHPYLTQRLCRALLEKPPLPVGRVPDRVEGRGEGAWDEAAVAEVVEQTFFGEKSKQDGNLGFVRDMLTLRAPERYKLTILQLLRDIHKGRKIKDEEQAIPKMHLKLAGIVRREGERLVLRNKIYAHVFDPKWLKQNWPVSWKKRSAYAGALVMAVLLGVVVNFVAQNYWKDLLWQVEIWQAEKAYQNPPTPYLDAKGIKMVTIEGRTFMMGSENGWDDEQPIHQVYLDEFSMDVYEVTNQQYRKCVEAGVCQPPSEERSYNRFRYYNDPFYNNYPVIYVDWDMAKTYCEDWRGARLPTEAEWEYAARGGLEGKDYPWGNIEPVCTPGAMNGANFGECALQDTMPVGTFAPNGYGLYDMAGNVWEWTADWFVDTYYQTYPTDQWPPNPAGPENGDIRVLRGGSWYFIPDDLRVSVRGRGVPSNRTFYLGFRCSR